MKYGKALTIILIIAIIGIVIGLCFLGYGVYKKRTDEDDIKKAISKFNNEVNNTEEKQEETTPVNQVNIEYNNTDTDSNNSSTTKKKVMYQNYVMLGTIEISKTNVSLPILEEYTQNALNKGACLLYKTNDLNQPGNVVLIGHNYRNGTLFSNNKKLSAGDKISIKDTTGNKVSYTIYQTFETTPEDTSFYNRDTNGVAEITLSTCTDDGASRLIILAKAN